MKLTICEKADPKGPALTFILELGNNETIVP